MLIKNNSEDMYLSFSNVYYNDKCTFKNNFNELNFLGIQLSANPYSAKNNWRGQKILNKN